MAPQPKSDIISPPLRWAGSKRAILSRLTERAPRTFGRYVEPFFGSGCLFFALRPASAVLSDFNHDLIEFYRELRRRPIRIHALATRWEEDDYYEVRALDATTLTSEARAARFLYLNRYAFNGVYRTNRRGQFNVPRGSRTSGVPSSLALKEAARALRSKDLAARDFLETTARARRGDFVYLDPPYVNDLRATYGEYGYGAFQGAADVSRLADELMRLDRTGARVLLSFGSVDGLESAIAGWSVEHVNSQRRVAAKLSARTSNATEILAWNY